MPESETLYKILEILFTEKEAEYVSMLPLTFFKIEDAQKKWNVSKDEAIVILDQLSDKAILLDLEKKGERYFIVAPTMAGFFEFSLMRTDGKFDRKILSELFYQYINQEENFVRRIFGNKTSIDRVFLHEDVMPKESSVILDYEHASAVIKNASCISVGTCYCRHKMEHIGKACNNPQDVCLTLNKAAESLIKHNVAKRIEVDEALRILDRCINLGLVQIGDNVQDGVNWICNCCSCCCEAILSYKKLGYFANLTSNFESTNNFDKCKACGVCVKKCPVDAISMKIENENKYAVIDVQRCIGCGVCVRYCGSKSLSMKRKEKPLIVPKDSFERMVLNAIDTGTLQDYLFDNYSLLSHKLLRNFLGVLVSIPPVKQIMASEQLKSRFVNRLIKTKYYDVFDKIYNDGKVVDYSHKELR